MHYLNFFTEELAQKIAVEEGKADITIARNVIPHVKEIHSVIKGMKSLLKDEGTGIIEFHNAGIVIKTIGYNEKGENMQHMSFPNINYINIVSEEEWEDSERTMTPLLGLYSDEKGSYGTYSIELEEELDPKRIVYTIAETQFGDMVDWWGYVTKDNKIAHFDSQLMPEGDSKGMYSTLGWKLDSDKWDCDIPWDECEKAIADGEIEFD